MSTKTIVVFRKWRSEPKTVFALFPEEPADYSGLYCSSYEHIGQHGAADYHGCIEFSRPATKAEYADLRAELECIGYDLRPVKRASYAMHETRRKEARKQ